MTQIALSVQSRAETTPHPGMGFRQFVGLVAALMAVNALAVDSMLPALPAIAHSLGLPVGNKQQWIVTVYLLSFGSSQIVYGPLADRFGRRPVLMAGLIIYVATSMLAAMAGSIEMLLFARVCQGIGSAATRVLVVSIVRDCYAGNQMARVMSLAFIVFLAVPILAPSIGQIIMLVLPWRGIFWALALFGLVVTLWVWARLPETMHERDRLPIAPGRIYDAFRVTLTNRSAVGYMLAMTFIMGGLFGFINSAQQIFVETFQAPRLFTGIFAGIAFFMALASLLNSRVVGRVGTRPVSHCALLGYLGIAFIHTALVASGHESIVTFAILQAGTMFCFGLVASNFGALAMEPLGHIAGTASSIQGFATTAGGALLGFVIGQHFDGTTLPLEIGFLVYGLAAFALVLFSERGRLFRRVGARGSM
ncbi:multidrug effflux MFS transporter [Lichenifustis flavocetrariae]|uniref:Bcr/CflA family efflux transporter n=1 Tax=Lichenifustis flavocetrariae TaxID=2949735 RepID=A0AA41YT62_9HYPH|nr:multidrug effflux MFS transporter [Lichenifustis flavocetrariae]MCW6506746.1 multidrug effflux MFS transporter [Lichenifustis flavocetrariae]